MVALLEPTRLDHNGHSTGHRKAKVAADRADRFFDAGMLEEALLEYADALKKTPGDSYLFNNRGAAYARLGRHEEALVDFSRALELNPENPFMRRHKAFALAEMKRFAEALDVIAGSNHPAIVEARRAVVELQLRQLVKSGFVSWAGGKPKGSKNPVKLTPGPPISDYIVEERERIRGRHDL